MVTWRDYSRQTALTKGRAANTAVFGLALLAFLLLLLLTNFKVDEAESL